MQHTIESFVHQLQQDGIAAGRAAGEDVRKQAESEAKEIISRAQNEAARIIDQAIMHEKEIAQRQEQDLRLAARDAVLELQQKLAGLVTNLIDSEAASLFKNKDYLGRLIESVVTAFAIRQAEHPNEAIVFNVAGEDARNTVNQAIAKITAQQDSLKRELFSVDTNLMETGFEYRLEGNVVEVTPQAIATLLMPLVNQEVSQRLSAIMTETEKTMEYVGDHSEAQPKQGKNILIPETANSV